MMDDLIIPNEKDIDKLKSQISDMSRKAEHEKLKQELAELTREIVHAPNEFEGAMQVPDTQKALTTKRKRAHFFDLVINRVRDMASLRPIVGNVIAIGLAVFALYYINTQVQGAVLEEYQSYLGTGVCIIAGLQILKSATRSILLPIVALMIGSSVAHTLGVGELLLGHDITFYQCVMGVGIVGVGLSVLSID